jgi:hypothetical protein
MSWLLRVVVREGVWLVSSVVVFQLLARVMTGAFAPDSFWLDRRRRQLLNSCATLCLVPRSRKTSGRPKRRIRYMSSA